MARARLGEKLFGVKDQAAAREIVAELWPIFRTQRNQVINLDQWYRNDLSPEDLPAVPRTNNEHHVHLRDRSSTGWARLVVSTVSQALYLEGMRSERARDNSPLWDIWQGNGRDAGQIGLHRSALAHGMAYSVVSRGTDPLTGDPLSVIRNVSAKHMVAVYEENGDQFPRFAMQAEPQSTDDDATEWVIKLWEDGRLHRLTTENASAGSFTYISGESTGLGVVPVQRFACLTDLDDYVEGEIAPFIPLFGRIDQDTFDRLVVQRFGAFKVRFGTGVDMPKVDADRRAAVAQAREGDLLMSPNKDTRFGTLDETPLDGYIKGRDSDLRDLASVTQTPPHHLLGAIANLSAEALAAAEASLMRKVDERKHTFGEAHEMTLRLAGLMGTPEQITAAQDYTLQVRWKDTESRSLNQVADALGKLATMLEVPVEMLWERIPGWTDADTKDAKELRQQMLDQQMLLAAVTGEVDGGNNPAGIPADSGAPGGTGSAL
jgi:hypothetical protein